MTRRSSHFHMSKPVFFVVVVVVAILFRVYGAEPGLTTEPLKLRLAHFPGGSNIQTSHDFSQKS
jgi:hypothetical protein